MANRLTNLEVRKVLGKIGKAAATNITGATNATPIVITSAAHGLETGDRAVVLAVGGNTAAIGHHNTTKVDANSFSLDGSAGNAAYTSGGTVERIFAQPLPSDLAGIQDALSRISYVRGQDNNPAAETNVRTLLEGLTTL